MKKRGFTIIELMIATAIFSVILLLCMAAIMQITRLYYRGVTQANTQEVARAILDEFSQAVQFSNNEIFVPSGDEANPAGPEVPVGEDPLSFICLGNKRYSFMLDRQLVSSNPSESSKQVSAALWVDSPKSDDGTPLGCASAVSAQSLDLTDQNEIDASDGVELLDENMRITQLEVTPAAPDSDAIWNIAVTVVYGDQDLLENPDGNRVQCKPSGPGVEFCAISEISTTVRRRVE